MGDSNSSFSNVYQENFTENTNAQNINADIDNLTHTNDTDATINNLLNRNNFTARDHLFQAMFSRIALTYDRTFPPFARRFIEFMLLLTAISVLFILIYIHMAFVKAPITCLDHLTFNENTIRDSADGPVKQMVIRVEVLSNPPSKYSLYNSYSKEYDDLNRINQSEPLQTSRLLTNERVSRLLMFLNIIHKQCHRNSSDIENRQQKLDDDKLYLEIKRNEDKHSDKSTDGILFNLFNFPINPILEKAEYWREKLSVRAMAPFRHTFNELELFAKSVFTEEKYIMEYSLEYGLLRLTPQTRERLNIPVHFVLLDANKDQCFGNGISRFLLQEFVGYDQIIIGSLKRLAERQNGKGYVRNVVSGEHYRFVNSWMSRTSYLAAGFIMIIFTLSVSMLLRYSHHQIFVFIVDLLRMLENNLQFSFPAAPLLTVVLALVGMEAIMSEFFNDTSTAFYTILIIWLADQYEAVCCRTYVSKRHWPKYFYLYHFAFYAYHYRFNGQFSGLALLCSWLFIQHSMFFFFHHYELPRLMHGIAVRAIMDSLIVERTENRSRTPTSMYPNDDDNDRSDGDRNDRDHEDPEPSLAMPSMAASGENRQEDKRDQNQNNESEQCTDENQEISNDSQSSYANDRPFNIFHEFFVMKALHNDLSTIRSSRVSPTNQKRSHVSNVGYPQIYPTMIHVLRPPTQTNIKLLTNYHSRSFHDKFIKTFHGKHQICLLDQFNSFRSLSPNNITINYTKPSAYRGLQSINYYDYNMYTVMIVCIITHVNWELFIGIILCSTMPLAVRTRSQYCFQSRYHSAYETMWHQSIPSEQLDTKPIPVHLSLNSLGRQVLHNSFPAANIGSDIVNYFLENSISLKYHSNQLLAVPSFIYYSYPACTESSALEAHSEISSPCLHE